MVFRVVVKTPDGLVGMAELMSFEILLPNTVKASGGEDVKWFSYDPFTPLRLHIKLVMVFLSRPHGPPPTVRSAPGKANRRHTSTPVHGIDEWTGDHRRVRRRYRTPDRV